MNYAVHAVMYGYYMLMALALKPAWLPPVVVTLLQLAQMVVGIFVTVRAVVYQANGRECAVNKTNSLLGLAMYVSYFLLFLQLFLRSYVWKTHKKPETRAGARTSGWKSPLKAE